jgi:hypothetical protein
MLFIFWEPVQFRGFLFDYRACGEDKTGNTPCGPIRSGGSCGTLGIPLGSLSFFLFVCLSGNVMDFAPIPNCVRSPWTRSHWAL